MSQANKSKEELQKLRVVDLRKELSSLSLPTAGKKDELVQRLFNHYSSQAETEETSDESPDTQNEPNSLEDSERLAAEEKESLAAEERERLAAEDKERLAVEEKERLAAEENDRLAAEEKERLATEEKERLAAEEKERLAAEEKERLAAEENDRLAAEEKERLAAEEKDRVLAEQQQQLAAEQMRLAKEQEELQSKKAAEEDASREQQMLALVQQQQELLGRQKSVQEASQRHSRVLQEQRQQLEAVLRQNSVLQSQNKGNQQILDQLQQQRNQLLTQGEALSSQLSTFSAQNTTYVDQRQLNEQIIKQVMEQEQRQESEQQRQLLLEKQQRYLVEHQQLLLSQQQALEQQAHSADLLRQQQVALLERQKEQEERVQMLRQEALNREREKEEAMKVARKQAEVEAEMRRKEQERAANARAPPSLLSMDTKPATAGLKLTAPSDADDEKKLPKALEDVLALKDIRAKQVGVEDMEQAVEESRSSVTVTPAVAAQRPLGDVNEYDDDEDEDEKPTSKTKDSKNRKRKKKRKTRAARKAEEKAAAAASSVEKAAAEEESESTVEVEYVQEKPLVDITNPLYSQFHKIFEAFKIEETQEVKAEDGGADDDSKAAQKTESDPSVTKRGAALFGELENEPMEPVKRDTGALSKKQLKKLTRMSVAQLKTVVTRPDLVEMHDVTGPDPKLLLHLKATRNTVAVPRHWCNKRKYLQGKRGFEKSPFELPDYIQATGIMEMRQALADKETDKSLKQKMREKVRPKMGKIDIDYQKLHDAFFKYQRKPKMTLHGDLYYEGKEFETRLREKKPGNLSDELRTALGMPIGAGAERFPPPWLIAMQRYGPPPSYPNLKIPGLNAPIPEGCSFGYHAGGWGKPPVDETGKPLYGDVFGQNTGAEVEPSTEDTLDKTHWGEMESESEEESESESEEERDEEEMAAGLITPAEAGLITPSGLTSIPAGMETPDAIELRKKIEDSMESGGGDTPALYQVLPEKRATVGAAMMGSAHTYDVGAAKKVTAEGVEVTLNPDELDMDTVAMQAKYDQTMKQQQANDPKEDFSDMVAEHSAKAAKKRKKQQTSDRASKKHKDFKF